MNKELVASLFGGLPNVKPTTDFWPNQSIWKGLIDPADILTGRTVIITVNHGCGELDVACE